MRVNSLKIFLFLFIYIYFIYRYTSNHWYDHLLIQDEYELFCIFHLYSVKTVFDSYYVDFKRISY